MSNIIILSEVKVILVLLLDDLLISLRIRIE